VAYYIHPYHQDFTKAKQYADKIDYSKWIKIYPHDRIEKLMRAYIGVGEYEKAIEVYRYNENHFDQDMQSLGHTNLLLGAAYAGLGDMETSFDYVSREFAITEVKDPEKKFDKANPFDTKGDMLVSLYELFFVFDEYEKYEGTKWFDRLEEMVNRNLARYKHLRVFNRR
jgi:tetratricopeptide (TPR) repeat protein